MSRFPNQPYRVGRKCPLFITHDEKNRTASVRFRGEIRELRAAVWSREPLTLRVHGFAAAFHSGAKVWPATVTFVEFTPGTFRYDDLTIHGFPSRGNGNPPHVIGFIEDVKINEQGRPQDVPHWLRESLKVS